jgi:ribosomal 50S subunit-recycling heat shock protein
MPDAPPQSWDDLTAGEVRAALEQMQAAGQAAVSAFLDVHQWLPLAGQAGIATQGGHPAARFRCAALDAAPALALWRLDLAALAPGQRGPRALRRLLEAGGPGHPALGDMAVNAAAAVVVALPGWEPEPPLAASALEAWPVDFAPAATASVASLRLDALVAALFRVSRSEASVAIEQGYVFVNFAPAGKAARHVAAGDVLVLRGKGHAELLASQANTRSGRVRVEYRAYLG